MSHNAQFSRRSLSREVSLGLILTIFLVSTLSFFIALKVAKTRADVLLNAKADEFIQSLQDILIVPIWNYDYETIEVIGKSYLQNEHIAGITIVDSRGKTCVSVMKKDVVPVVTRSVNLRHYDLPMGFVEIALSSKHYNLRNRQLFWYFSVIILINLMTLIIMTGFLLRWSLNKPLQLLNQIVESYDPKKNVLPDSFSSMPYTEFMPLIETLNGMGDEIKQQMLELEDAEQKYRSIFESATEGIFQSTPEGKVLNANPAFAEILGYRSPEELIANVHDIGQQHYVSSKEREALVAQIKEEQVITFYEVQFKKRDGQIIWVSLNIHPVYDPHGKIHHIEGLVQDITVRKKVENQVRRLSTAVEQVAENMIITDDSGRIKYVNPAFELGTGFDLHDVFDHPHHFLGMDETEKMRYDDILLSTSEGNVWTGQLTSNKKNGEELIEEVTASPIKSPSGRFLGYVSVNRDVTLKAEYETRLRQSQKMEAIGTLAGGIAHDFNNILGVIIGCSELVRNSLHRRPQMGQAIKDIEQVLTASMRAKSLVSQILTFSRQDESKRIPLILSPLIKEVIKFLKATLPNYITINYIQEIDNGVVLADPVQMQQILMNLCTNSSQAIGQNHGEIEVRLSQADVLPHDKLSPDVAPGSYVVIRIRDDGPGIDEKIQHKIFDPFFTTKGVGEGTGLGLSVVHGIVKKHDGAIVASSREGEGASFTVWLPRVEHDDFKISVEPMVELPQGNETILLVDDERVLLDILDRILSNLGYDVEAHFCSSKALEAFNKRADEFDLVITDQVMPDLTGPQLTHEIRKRKPDLPVILFTGFNEVSLEMTDCELPRFDRVIKKPLMNSDFAFAVRKVLDDSQRR